MTKPVVRFAPSPTGRLHVGNVRTALINWLFAKKEGGSFILRIDDTDTERSTAEFHQAIEADLTWLGLVWDKTFKQSDRFAQYDAARDKLVAAGLLYACYETPDELERARKIALSRGRPPVYNRAALDLTEEDKAKLVAEGRKPHWRFKLSGERCDWTDLVRGAQSIDTSSISDPVLIRADGSYLYTLPSVVDDIEYGITHVVRGEDHVTNSGAQIEIFRALGGKPPQMAHTPLLIGADGQGLSKRLGSLSIGELRDAQGIEPMAVTSLLGKIGTSDSVEARSSLDELAAEFSFEKIGRAPARFDEKELSGLNAALVANMDFEAVKPRLEALLAENSLTSNADKLQLFWESVKGNLNTVKDANLWAQIVFGDIDPVIEDDDREYVSLIPAALPDGEFTSESWGALVRSLKERTGRKGKRLFMPLRLAITGQRHGPEMDNMLVLIGHERLLKRLGA